MMKLTISLFKKIIFTCIAICFLNSFTVFANTANEEITINNISHCLTIDIETATPIAWYKNDELIIGAKENSLTIKEGGIYKVAYKNKKGVVVNKKIGVMINAAGAIIKIYLIGDSTVSNYAANKYPMAGWGQVLGAFFNSANIQVDNRAIGGRSSRSFYLQGRWTPVKDALKAGDYVFIQFGHNDRNSADTSRYTSVTDYKRYLTIYCNDAKAKGAIPVLVSPMVMNAWRGTTMRNVFTEAGNDYRGAMLAVATSLNVAFVDLNMKSWNLYKTYGQSYISRFIYHTYVAGEYPNYPNGINDGTHFQEMGAINNAKMITEGIKELSARADMGNLINNLKIQYKVTVSVTPTGSDVNTTKTATYPQGLTITLKTLPKNTFQKWNNAAGAQVATSNMYKFTSTAAASSFTAVYRAAALAGLFASENITTDIAAKNELEIYPNPVSDILNVKCNNLTGATIKIIDTHGRIVYNNVATNRINISLLTAGVYSLVLTKNNATLLKRFVVRNR